MKHIILFLLLFPVAIVSGQTDCGPFYDTLMNEAKQAFEQEDYRQAFEKYLAARGCKNAGDNLAFIDQSIEQAMEGIDNQKGQAERGRDSVNILQLKAIAAWKAVEREKNRATKSLQANRHAALAFEKYDIDPTLAWHLAMLAWENSYDTLERASIEPAVCAILHHIIRDTTIWLAQKLEKYAGNVTCASFSPDGKRMVTASRNKNAISVRIWDENGYIQAELTGHDSTVRSAVFSPDGKFVLTASDDKTARLWENGQTFLTLKGHIAPVTSAAFSQDGEWIITASRDSTARIWDINGRLIKTLPGHKGQVLSAAFSPDGKMIVTGSTDSTARIWDINGKLHNTLKGHTGALRSAVFSPLSNDTLLTAGEDGTVRLWDKNGKLLDTLKGHNGIVQRAAFSPNGNLIVTAGADNIVRLWSLAGQELFALRGHVKDVNSAVFSPDGRQVLTASEDGTTRLWENNARARLQLKEQTGITCAAFSPDGRLIATASKDTTDNTARLWDKNGQLFKTLRGHSGIVRSVQFSPDGKHILTESADSTARLWGENGKLDTLLRALVMAYDVNIESAALSPNGSQILTRNNDGSAEIWWTLKGEVSQTFRPDDSLSFAMFSPDGTQILAASSAYVQMWSITGQPMRKVEAKNFIDAKFSPNGQQILLLFKDRAPYLWNDSRKSIGNDAAENAAFSPDNTMMLTISAGNVRLWDNFGNIIGSLKGHTSAIVNAVFSPNGAWILTAAEDGTVQLWDRKGHLLQTLSGHSGKISSMAFSPDGEQIMTAGDDGKVLLWDNFPAYKKRYWTLPDNDLLLAGAEIKPTDTIIRYMTFEELNALGNILYERGDWPNARRVYEAWDKRSDHDANLLTRLYDIAKKQGQDFDFRRFQQSSDVWKTFRYADYFKENEEWAYARTLYEQGLSIQPEPNNLLSLYEVCRKGGFAFDFNRFLKTGSSDDIFIYANYFKAKKYWSSARTLYEEGLSKQSDSDPYNLLSLYEVCEAGRFVFDSTRFLKTNSPDAIFIYAAYFKAKKNWSFARTLYEEGLKITSDPKQLISLYQVWEKDSSAFNFNFNRFLQTNDPDKLIQYADFFDNVETGKNRDNVPYAQKAVTIGKRLLEIDSSENNRIKVARYYNSLGYYQLFDTSATSAMSAERSIQKGIKLYPDPELPGLSKLPNLNKNLFHAILLQGRFKEAKKMYLEWKDKAYNVNFKTYKDIFLLNFKTLEDQGVTHPDIRQMREELLKVKAE